MRLLWMVVVALSLGCSPRTCEDTCQGCCDASGECRPGNTLTYCGVSGRACSSCITTDICSPTGACTSSGAGGGMGGGGGATGGGGGGAATPYFVTISFDRATCCDTCACKRCQMASRCEVTKTVPSDRFQQLRAGSLSACAVTQTASDGFSVNCTGRCMTTQTTCRVGTDDVADTVISCAAIAGTTSNPCDWTP